uniref:Uncharacterized protein n=1 Tax=Megaselia scalaris TaxID=36166 RepID=T1GPE9_MEGSC
MLKKNSKSREKRWLLFPRTSPTRTQFIAGIGIPVEDLLYESITSGYVFKAEYYLPYLAEQWHTFTSMKIGELPIQGRRRRSSETMSLDMLTKTLPIHVENFMVLLPMKSNVR